MTDPVPLPLASMPTLTELASDPGLLERLPTEALVALRSQLRHLDTDVDATLARRLVHNDGQPAPLDRLLDVEEAAKRLGCSEDWVYRHQDELPVVRIGRHVKFSATGLDTYIRRRQGRRP